MSHLCVAEHCRPIYLQTDSRKYLGDYWWVINTNTLFYIVIGSSSSGRELSFPGCPVRADQLTPVSSASSCVTDCTVSQRPTHLTPGPWSPPSRRSPSTSRAPRTGSSSRMVQLSIAIKRSSWIFTLRSVSSLSSLLSSWPWGVANLTNKSKMMISGIQ